MIPRIFPAPGLLPYQPPDAYSRRVLRGVERIASVRRMFGVPPSYIRHAGAIADSIVVPASATTEIVPATATYALQRFEVQLRVQGAGVARHMEGIRFRIFTRIEEDEIERRVFLGTGNATAIFAPGRSLRITAENTSAIALTADVAVDEAATPSGHAQWTDCQFLTNVAAGTEVDLDIPPFCVAMAVLTTTAGPAPTLRGYDSAGTAVYTELLPVPRAVDIPRVPGFDYTLALGGVGPLNATVFYICEG